MSVKSEHLHCVPKK